MNLCLYCCPWRPSCHVNASLISPLSRQLVVELPPLVAVIVIIIHCCCHCHCLPVISDSVIIVSFVCALLLPLSSCCPSLVVPPHSCFAIPLSLHCTSLVAPLLQLHCCPLFSWQYIIYKLTIMHTGAEGKLTFPFWQEDDCCPYFHSWHVFFIQEGKGMVGRQVGPNKNRFDCRASRKISNRRSQHEFPSIGRQCTFHHNLGVTLILLGSGVLSWGATSTPAQWIAVLSKLSGFVISLISP